MHDFSALPDIDAGRLPVVRITDTNEAMADSRDVATYFDRRHADVLRDIRNLYCTADFRERNFAPFKNNDLTGEFTSHVDMTKDGFVFLAMGFTGAKAAIFKERYIGAFNVMEAELRNRAKPTAPAHILPQSFADALQLAANQARQLEQQQVVIDTMKPKADFHDAVADAENCQEMQVVAKVLGTGRTRLFYQLRQRGLLMAGNLPYQQYIDAGYFRVVERVWRDPEQKPHTTFKTLVTGKGLAYIQKLLTPPAPPATEAA